MRYSLPLTHVYIAFENSGHSVDLSGEYDFTPMLKHRSAALESIHLDYINFSSIAELVFPRVHTFGIGRLEFGIRRSTLVRHFPRLTALYIQDVSLGFHHNIAHDEWHTTNSSEPLQLQWPHLERVNIPPRVIYGLNLWCTSRFLCITNYEVYRPPFTIDPQTLVNCHPSSIAMRVGRSWQSVDLVQAFLRESPQLSHVGFSMRCDEILYGDPDVYEVFDRIVCLYLVSPTLLITLTKFSHRIQPLRLFNLLHALISLPASGTVPVLRSNLVDSHSSPDVTSTDG
ncbi:hypothetical protein K474DRAFT_800164 [Panus rudis PR-1116 ss-1]|nr:hypothetical protein K474DRAFT_800164 [Panus rudis PR-1116 ss-1]